jgi:hypothetical protein
LIKESRPVPAREAEHLTISAANGSVLRSNLLASGLDHADSHAQPLQYPDNVG